MINSHDPRLPKAELGRESSAAARTLQPEQLVKLWQKTEAEI